MFLSLLLLLVSLVAAVQLDPTLNYTVTRKYLCNRKAFQYLSCQPVAGGKVSGCNPLVDMLNNHGCEDNAGVQDLWVRQFLTVCRYSS